MFSFCYWLTNIDEVIVIRFKSVIYRILKLHNEWYDSKTLHGKPFFDMHCTLSNQKIWNESILAECHVISIEQGYMHILLSSNISKKWQKDRLTFANVWTVEKWTRVFFSNECKINLVSSNDKQDLWWLPSVWRKEKPN